MRWVDLLHAKIKGKIVIHFEQKCERKERNLVRKYIRPYAVDKNLRSEKDKKKKINIGSQAAIKYETERVNKS